MWQPRYLSVPSQPRPRSTHLLLPQQKFHPRKSTPTHTHHHWPHTRMESCFIYLRQFIKPISPREQIVFTEFGIFIEEVLPSWKLFFSSPLYSTCHITTISFLLILLLTSNSTIIILIYILFLQTIFFSFLCIWITVYR